MIMKKIFIFTLGVMLFSFCHAQDSASYFTKRNEINIGYLNILSLNSSNTFGIGYKINLCDGALRLRINYNYNNHKQSTPGQTFTYTNLTTDILPKLGYEFRLKFKRSMVFYGVDLCGSYYHNKSSYSDSSYSYDNITVGYGASPFIGYEYYINKNVSLSTETSFDFLYSKGKTKYTNGANATNSDSENETISAKLSPLGIFSINFHF